MKKLVSIVALLLVTVFALTLVGCSKYGSLQKAFTNAGYVEVKELDGAMEELKKKYQKDEFAVTVHAFASEVAGIKIPAAIIFEFKATDDLRNYLNDNENAKSLVKDLKEDADAQAIYNNLVEKGFVKGNCFVIPAIANPSKITEIVKKA